VVKEDAVMVEVEVGVTLEEAETITGVGAEEETTVVAVVILAAVVVEDDPNHPVHL
jgi:hypothetical protein